MATRYLVQRPHETRLSLIVDVISVADNAAVDRLKNDMYGRGCAHGLLVSEQEIVVLRDTFTGHDERSIVVEGRLSLPPMLRGTVSLELRTERWLAALAEDRKAAMPPSEEEFKLLTDVTLALAGAEVDREYDAA